MPTTWEGKLEPDLSDFFFTSVSDVVGRATACWLIWSYFSHSKSDLRVCVSLCVLVALFGNVVTSLFLVWKALKQVAPHVISLENNPFPRFTFTHDAVCLVVLTAWGLYLRCFNLSTPKYLIFDEVHFGKFMNGHITGEFYFDIHPPVVKLVMAWFVQYFTPWYKGEQPFRDIGEEYLPDSPVKAMRFIPAFASTLIIPTTYITCRELGITWWGSLVCASMCLFDNLHVTEGRVLTTDTCLVFFLAASLLFYVRSQKNPKFSNEWYLNLTMTGIFLGITMSTKWIALNIFGVVGVFTAIDVLFFGNLFKRTVSEKDLYDFVIRLLLLLGIPVIIYVFNFYMWVRTTPKWGEFGPYHMPLAFQARLEGSKVQSNEPEMSFYDIFIHMNTAMFTGNRDVGKGMKGHPWESWWYQWPLNLRGLACWSSGMKFDAAKGNSFEQHVYFLGNPFVWWLAALSLSLWLLSAFTPRRPRKPIQNFHWKSSMLLLGYFSGLLPYVAVRRSCFIYHYMPPLHFLVILTGLVLDHLVFRYFSRYHIKLAVVFVILAIFAWSFWFFSPLCYGTPMTKNQYEARIWRPGWR
eukprot:c4460_g1_i1.p1 GENE.c4460_g1_i1~~c4460_g1_i1.p1  ORF type:complete len:590 (-),score=89.61 c4460_g1_i1:55-1788(-)